MNCEQLKDLVAGYLAGELSAEARKDFEAHMGGCQGCRTEVTELEATWSALGFVPDADPGPEMRPRFYAMLEEEKRRLAGSQKVSWSRRAGEWLESWWPRRPAAQMAMAAGLLVVGLAAGSFVNKAPDRSGEITRLNGEVEQLNQMVSLSFLDRSSSTDRLRGVNWSSRVDEPSGALLTMLSNTLESDPNVNVRAAAVDALSVFRDEPGVVDVLTRSLLQEESPTVQVALIDLLTEIREQRALEALMRFVEMSDVLPPVKEHAETRINDFM
jgi:hypothetical protein